MKRITLCKRLFLFIYLFISLFIYTLFTKVDNIIQNIRLNIVQLFYIVMQIKGTQIADLKILVYLRVILEVIYP